MDLMTLENPGVFANLEIHLKDEIGLQLLGHRTLFCIRTLMARPNLCPCLLAMDAQAPAQASAIVRHDEIRA
jgi:hypothetical protein